MSNLFSFSTILSAFNERGTLLKWLKNLESALEAGTLTDVTEERGDTTFTLTFNFADGTKITSAAIPIVNGKDGKDGTNGVDGKNGKDGNGVTGITTIGYTEGTGQYAGYTETSINLDTTDATLPFKVYARNGEDGAMTLYRHNITIPLKIHPIETDSFYFNFSYIDTDGTPASSSASDWANRFSQKFHGKLEGWATNKNNNGSMTELATKAVYVRILAINPMQLLFNWSILTGTTHETSPNINVNAFTDTRSQVSTLPSNITDTVDTL